MHPSRLAHNVTYIEMTNTTVLFMKPDNFNRALILGRLVKKTYWSFVPHSNRWLRLTFVGESWTIYNLSLHQPMISLM